MNFSSLNRLSSSIAAAGALLLCIGCGANAASGSTETKAPAAQTQDGGMMERKNDPRKATTVQTAKANLGKTQDGVEVRYLNLPWGPTTFGYMENGGSNYYSNRTWPMAHIRLSAKANVWGKSLEPGDYVLIISPKGMKPSMELTFASFTPSGPNGTFLTPGDVFTKTPEHKAVASKPVEFGKGAPMSDALKIDVVAEGEKVALKIHYGDRTLTETLTAN
jgi:hypothetical protein